ncbi:hypothetical protein QFZ22_007894 [Streptomyces canus]|uniref:Uncharacterized protein n=1 Tax=Streptomyces canus TaxID=58343 RepID=A0AAW8FQB2_9ACTN|nr:hypothetical protein [Streptomyces canus]MDQ0911909.1 hypothetical protein [Streptomyces canus]
MSDAEGAPAPDFLDRLIARHAAPRPGAVRVQPRLPGPFERVEAVRDRAAAPDEDALLWPSATPPALPAPDMRRPAPAQTRTYTERERTVVRTERSPEQPAPRPAPAVRAEVPLLRPATPLAPVPRPLPDAGRRASGRAERHPSQTAASAPIPPGTDAAPTDVPAALRPSAADTAAARDAVRQAAARRPERVTEQVVQVQIGRLEVTAGDAPSGGGRQRTTSKERAGATVSLAEYLARGRE